MPPLVSANERNLDPNALRVLITGFGPFGRYKENPSSLAVRPLHNTILYTEPPAELIPTDQATMITDEMEELLRRPQQIHITTLELPVTYQAVLGAVPGFHILNGYDFVFHVGVAGRGPLRIERVGHKNGYRMKDAAGEYAPIVHLPKDPIEESESDLSREMRMLIGPPLSGSGPEGSQEVMDIPSPPNRGFGKGYEQFADELSTDVDVPKLIVHLKENGIDQVYSSMDAGHYLCDFIFYCSMAESKRSMAPQEKFKERSTPTKSTPVLFMHCPPVDQPLSTEQVTEAIQKIVLWVCGKMHHP
ncbi:peptidase C15 pyroglutamyl peptidase I-like protein [Epithele typhae]|uniref:peptidase C15 pyroglutamyl peptidase I-like protein n=1 Tax=Epithele typhae TaxID=378194 RepID=UPI0020089436|nr:peptidase C15 pyroglutamyl peptidase I-like protein [Epithele typhae]KAH9929540.1 peptidase C15 pyroglutamyl peptidase I-like protein [Epithele typhae]